MGVIFMSQKPVIYLGNLNVVRDSHRVRLLILDDDPTYTSTLFRIALNGKNNAGCFELVFFNRVVFGCKFKLHIQEGLFLVRRLFSQYQSCQ